MANGSNDTSGSTTSTTDTGSTPAFTASAGIALLEQLGATIPGFEAPDPKVKLTIIRKSTFPNEYMEAAANILEESDEIQRASHSDAASTRAGIALSSEIRALLTKAESFVAALRFTDIRLRASLVDTCDQVYALAPAVARKKKSLSQYIDAMQRASRRKGGRKKAAPPSPPPAGPQQGSPQSNQQGSQQGGQQGSSQPMQQSKPQA